MEIMSYNMEIIFFSYMEITYKYDLIWILFVNWYEI